MTDITLIVDARAHRRAENAVHQHEREHPPKGWVVIDMPTLDDDDWCCDRCSHPIDANDSIVCAGSNALCHVCASPIINNSELTRIAGEYLIPLCPCSGCTPRRP